MDNLEVTFDSKISYAGDNSIVPAMLELSGPLYRPLPSENNYAGKIPFAEILAPVVDKAVTRLRTEIRRSGIQKPLPKAIEDLRHALCTGLSTVAHQAFLTEFDVHKCAGKDCASALYHRLMGNPDCTIYETFVNEFRKNGSAAFYKIYPEAARLFTRRIHGWLTASLAIFKAVANERRSLSQTFGISHNAALTGISTGLSDLHHGGRSVAILTFNDSSKVVFKPRKLMLEAGFMRILRHLNDAVGNSYFRTVQILAREDYGWCEYIPHTRCTGAEIASYYRRMGYLLAVLYAFRATDCHTENIIACDGYPVAVDLETLFHPRHELFREAQSLAMNESPINDTVCRTGLLPSKPSGDESPDVSPLGASIDPQMVKARHLRHYGTVLMALEEREHTFNVAQSQPSEAPAEQHVVVTEIIQGFREGYELVLQERHSMLGLPHMLPSLRNTSCRFVVRPTIAYALLQRRSLAADGLQSRSARRALFDRLYKTPAALASSDLWLKLGSAERQALENTDIPHFNVPLSGRALYSGSKEILSEAFTSTPYELVVNRLQTMSINDCNNQTQVIELSFAQRGPTKTTTPSTRPKAPSDSIQPLILCRAIAERIWSASFTNEGKRFWVGLASQEKRDLFRIDLTGPGLYAGNAGIALFYAALYALDSEKIHKQRARSLFDSLVLSDLKFGADGQFLLDSGDGLAGIAFALHHGARLLLELDLAARALEFANEISEDLIENCSSSDVIGGLAGVALSLMAIHRHTSSAALLRKIRVVGAILLAREVSLSPSCSAWKTTGDVMLPGFAHGSAGIAYALARIGRLINESRYLDAARRGLNYEKELFDQQLGTWPDLRTGACGAPLACSWCHGALGIGLAYENIFEDWWSKVHDEDCKERILRCVTYMLQKDSGPDTMCCGTAGAMDLILKIPRDRDSASMLSTAQQLLSDESAYRYLPMNNPNPFVPGLFNGAAGIGYQLLRSIARMKIPSVLLFD